MTRKIDWRRAKKIGPTESCLGSDVEMKDGARTPKLPSDRLSRRADRAMDQWLRSLPAHVRRQVPA